VIISYFKTEINGTIKRVSKIFIHYFLLGRPKKRADDQHARGWWRSSAHAQQEIS
jgi:hypothetical protein